MCQYTDYKFGYSDYYRRRMWIGSGEIIVPIWDRNYGNEKRGMRFFSQTLAEKDIKTEKMAKMMQVRAGMAIQTILKG